MGWVVMLTHQELSTPKCDVTCVDHARITLPARVIRATPRKFRQSSSYLLPIHIFYQRVPWRLQFYMEAAILIICYLAGILVVLFCFYQLAGLLDKLTYQEPSIKVWLPKKFSTIMDLQYAVQVLISLLIISLCLLILLAAMICSSVYQTLPTLIRHRNENETELKQTNQN